MRALWRRLLVTPRAFTALLRVFLLVDLRGQHYARATASKPHFLFTPLFWVVGQCLTLSAVTSLVLFARTDVFFFVFVNLSLSLLVLASTLLVEFNEVVFDPSDLEHFGHRPVAPRAYAAARAANLLFYGGLMFLALNLFPLLLGAGLRDATRWYIPAYLAASLAGHLAVTAMVVLLLPARGSSARLEHVKEILAWTQIVLILVVGYGAQLMFRDGTHALLMWGAFPPPWVEWVPSAWLARFVESAGSASATLLLAGIGLASFVAIVWRVGRLYESAQPRAARSTRRIGSRQQVGRLGGRLAGWIAPEHAQRVGFWLFRVLLVREPGLKMRCLWPLNLPVAAVLLGLATRQFANPLCEQQTPGVALPILAVYLLALAVPAIVHNLTFSSDYQASWILRVAPLDRPQGIARGVCKAVLAYLLIPAGALFGVVAAFVWQDPLSAILHVVLAWALCWLMALTALALVVTDLPFSVPHARGSATGPLALPLAVLSLALLTWAGIHYLFAHSPWFWIGSALACLLVVRPLERLADARLARLWETQACD